MDPGLLLGSSSSPRLGPAGELGGPRDQAGTVSCHIQSLLSRQPEEPEGHLGPRDLASSAMTARQGLETWP